MNPQINGEKFVFFLNVNLTVVPYTVATDLNGVFEGVSIKNKWCLHFVAHFLG